MVADRKDYAAPTGLGIYLDSGSTKIPLRGSYALRLGVFA
jgi:hypothetical protein